MEVADDAQRAALAAAGAQVLTSADSRYPALLRTIPDPPSTLYLRGDPSLLQRPQLAIVGARRASAAGLQAAAELASAASAAGLAICSGLAQGIDEAAHRAALRAGGKTIAVMGTGIDILYPTRNRSLGEEIAQRGCLVTEYPPGAPPLPGHFPRRNRIISGLSLGVVVVEAAERSGSLITARMATEQGREVFALPWSNAHKGGAGGLRLLRDGAKLVLGIDDVLEELESLFRAQSELAPAVPEATPQPTPQPRREPDSGLSKEQEYLLTLIGGEEVAVDELARLSGQSSAQVMAQLGALELAGRVSRGAGGYQRVPKGRITLPSGRCSG